MRDFTVGKGLTSAAKMGTCPITTSTTFSTKKFTPVGVLQMGEDFSKMDALSYP